MVNDLGEARRALEALLPRIQRVREILEQSRGLLGDAERELDGLEDPAGPDARRGVERSDAGLQGAYYGSLHQYLLSAEEAIRRLAVGS